MRVWILTVQRKKCDALSSGVKDRRDKWETAITDIACLPSLYHIASYETSVTITLFTSSHSNIGVKSINIKVYLSKPQYSFYLSIPFASRIKLRKDNCNVEWNHKRKKDILVFDNVHNHQWINPLFSQIRAWGSKKYWVNEHNVKMYNVQCILI